MLSMDKTSVLVAPYEALLVQARSAFRTDPSYAIAMAQQAQAARQRRANRSVDKDSE